ncbi:glycerol dehydrogenase [Xenophilus sp. AP218F]|nr:glycerol dehydrogenase [Xenophilus sp. AP218F]
MITTAIFPGRYVQGAGALAQLGDELARLGSQALVLQDPFVAEHFGEQLKTILAGKLDCHKEVFSSECCDEEIERLVALARQRGVDVVAGIGGGKTADTAKAVADALKAPVAIVPTLASTDAPCSALSVIYTATGEFKRYLLLPRNPDLILVDTAIIAKAPARFLVAGIGDALATWFEAEDCRASGANNMSGRPGPATAYGLARMCYELIMKYGPLAVTACEQQVVTPALERVVEANTLLSGLGFESGGLAAAHAIHNGLTVLPETHHYWHGEKVAFGVLAMLMLTNREPELIDEVYTLCEDVGLPTTLAALGLGEADDAALMRAAEAACAAGETIHNEPFPVAPRQVLAALKVADAYGRSRLGGCCHGE